MCTCLVCVDKEKYLIRVSLSWSHTFHWIRKEAEEIFSLVYPPTLWQNICFYSLHLFHRKTWRRQRESIDFSWCFFFSLYHRIVNEEKAKNSSESSLSIVARSNPMIIWYVVSFSSRELFDLQRCILLAISVRFLRLSLDYN